MGCCHHPFKQVIEEKERELEEKGSPDVPLRVKWFMGCLVIITFILMKRFM